MEKDYKKMYEDAINRAMNLALTNNISALAAGEIFPELNEAEDEKIRKAQLDYWRSVGGYEWHGVPVQETIAWLEKQKPLNNFNEAEKEKNDFVSGQFIECRKSFNEFEEDNSYWLEYIGDDTYIGRSDNVLNQMFHITPSQLFTLFTHEHCPKENHDEQKESNWNDMIKNLDKVEEYVLSLAPNTSLDAVKVHAKNIRFLVNDGQNPKTTPQWMIDFLDEYRRKIGLSMDYDEIRDTDGKVLAIVNWMKDNPNIQQKPAWSEDDKQYLLVCKNALYKYQSSDKWDATIIYNWLEEKLKSIKGRVQPQTKQEWNEEDESWFKELELMALSFSNDDSYRKKFFDWLKSLKDKVQSNKEWSEEDEKMKSLIISTLTSMGSLNLERYHNMNLDEVKNWLRSIKHHWKPSKYDISLLEEIARNIRNNVRPFCSEVSSLEDLIKNLKKL